MKIHKIHTLRFSRLFLALLVTSFLMLAGCKDDDNKTPVPGGDDDYGQEQEELREKLLQLNEDITQQEEQAENIDRFIGKVRKYLDLDELTPAILNDMVKAVYVHAPDKSSGRREQRIDISYDLVGILPAALLNDPSNGETV